MKKFVLISILASFLGIVMGYIAGANGGMEGVVMPWTGKGMNMASTDDALTGNGGKAGSAKKKVEAQSKKILRMTYDQAKKRMDEILWSPDGEKRYRLSADERYELNQLAARLGMLAPKSALRELDNISGLESKENIFKGIIAGWAEQDLEGVANYYRENRDTLSQTGLAGYLTGKWVEDSPERAWEFVSSLSLAERQGAMENFFRALIAKDPTMVAKYIKNSQVPEGIEEMFCYNPKLLKKWREADAEGYEQWASTLSENALAALEEEEKATGIDIVKEPEKAAEELKQKTWDERSRYLISQLWTMEREVGITKGFDWLKKSFPEGEAMHVLDHKMMTVKPKDFAALEQWIEGTTHDRIRARALRELSYSKPLPGHDMTKALDMAYKVGWEDKFILMQNMLENWVQVDENAALSWLDSPRCPEDKRKKWQEALDKKRKPIIK